METKTTVSFKYFIGLLLLTMFNTVSADDQDNVSAISVTSSGSGDVRWILPGPRKLDPKIFGTPAAPLGFEPDVGVPLAGRLKTADGSAWTTTAGPTPFSNNWRVVSGKYRLKATDATLNDTPDSKDRAKFSVRFTNPAGGSYKVTSSQVIPVGPDHPFLGGVGTHFYHHGMTGIGTKLMPTAPTYVAIWGRATLSRDGIEVANNLLVHVMTTCRVRDDNYNMVFDDGVDCSGRHTHMMMPPVALTPNGPIDQPVPTGFILPNGIEQPFIHVMFENIKLSFSADDD